MFRIRNDEWKQDADLRDCLATYVARRLRRTEILDFLKDKFCKYSWSLRSLDRRIAFFNIKYTDYTIDIERLRTAVQEELNGPGRLLGYRAMHQKVREIHQLNVPRDLVYAVMQELDATGLEERGGVGKPKRPRRVRTFHSEGSDYTLSLDGHDKLCGYQNSTFPLCVYGGQDTYSGRIQFLKVSTSNNDPKIIGKYYLEYLNESRRLPIRLRVDRGTETGDMTTMHCYLIDKYLEDVDATDFVLYGPSTENKIERFWRDLHHRLEMYFKEQLSRLLESGNYDPSNDTDRLLLAYVYIPVVQKELDVFRETVWNNHRCRRNNKKHLPTGIPEHLYFYPEKYGGVNCSLTVSEHDINEVAGLANINIREVNYLTDDFRDECMRHIDPAEIDSDDAELAYLYLKANFNPDH